VISQFIELEKELQEAVQSNDGHRIRDIDIEIADCFTQVLEFEPADAYERQEKCVFLLGRLCPLEDRHGIDEAVCNKIVALVSLDESIGFAKIRSK